MHFTQSRDFTLGKEAQQTGRREAEARSRARHAEDPRRLAGCGEEVVSEEEARERVAKVTLGVRFALTALFGCMLGYVSVVNPWRRLRSYRIRNPVAIGAWIAWILTLGSILTAIWSDRAANWFGNILYAIGRRFGG